MEIGTGRLVFPGGKQELKPFEKDMRKLMTDFASDMARRRRRVQPKRGKWFDLANEIIDVMIGAGPETTADMVYGLDYAVEECFQLLDAALGVMEKHGVVFYEPGGDGTISTKEFADRARARVEVLYNERLEQARRNEETWGGRRPG